MASTVKFLGPTLPRNLNCKYKNDFYQPNSSFQRLSPFQSSKKDPRKTNCSYITRRRENFISLNRCRSRKSLIVSSFDNIDSTPNSFSGYDVIMKFYSSINQKNVKQLSNCISGDCYIDDFSFPKAFQGKREAMKVFEQLINSMGQNVKFCVENVCEGDKYTAAANWHLEWKGRKIPFTRGCSFYEFAVEGGKLVIRNARVLIESPIKPGGVVLALLKKITILFDEFPKAAEWFLEKPYAIIQVIIRIYGLTLGPFINHMMAGYLKLMNIVAEFFFLVLKIIIKIQSFFSK